MPCITELNNLGDLLKYEAPNLYSREQVTVAEGQNLTLDSIVGGSTENDLIKVLSPTATDGTQDTIGVVISDVDARSIDTKSVVIIREAILADHAVVWPASITEEQKTKAIKQLEERGIIIRNGFDANPFLSPAFSMTTLTNAINILPINYGRTGILKLFPSKSVRLRHISIEEQNGVLSLLPTQVPGAR